jgi:hypothetical protein
MYAIATELADHAKRFIEQQYVSHLSFGLLSCIHFTASAGDTVE